MSDTENQSRPWVADGDQWVEHEDTLIGNREGLTRLRDHIDAAIQSGSSEVSEPGIQFEGVRVVETDPRGQGSWIADKIRLLAWAFFGSLFTVILALGIKGLVDLFR
jgi:hypothetical protein